jgi:hypothetical protein
MRGLLGLIGGYVIGAAIGAVGIELFSSNTHDKSVEMAMTSAFVTGPIGAVLGVIAALFWRR